MHEEAVPTEPEAGQADREGPADPIGSLFPRRQLAHRLDFRARAPRPGTRNASGPAKGTYALFPIPIPRPPAERVTQPIVCGQCGASIECTVYSTAATHRRRRQYLASCCASVGVAVAYCVYAALYFSQPADKSTEGWRVLVIPFLGILLLPALAIMAWGLLTLYREEDGVRIKPVHPHSLREPGAVADTGT